MKSIATRLRLARRAVSCTQVDLARRLGVSRSAVAQWERPEGSDPSAINLGRLAIELGCSYEWLATGRGNRQLNVRADSMLEDLEPVLRHFARTDDEERLLSLFREIDDWDRQLVLTILDTLATRSVHKRAKPTRAANTYA